MAKDFTAQDLNDEIVNHLNYLGDDQGEEPVTSLRRNANDDGFEIVMADGSAFQVSITQIRKAR